MEKTGVYAKLQQMGLSLPPLPGHPDTLSLARPLSDNILYLSGVGPNIAGEKAFFGKVYGEEDEVSGLLAARNTALHALAVLEEQLGDLNRVTGFVKLLVFVASGPDYYRQHIIANGASQLLIDLYGEAIGRSARSAVGVYSLPGNIPVETEMLVRFK